MSFNDPFADSEADPGTRVFVPRVQSLKNFKEAIRIFFINANAVIGNRKQPVLLAFLCRYVNDGGYLGSLVFDRVPDEILEDESNLIAFSNNLGKRVICNGRIALLDCDPEVAKGPVERRFAVCFCKFMRLGLHP